MGKKAKLYMTTRPEALVILLFLFSFALEAGRACSRPRQWKHGREPARLAAMTVEVSSRLQEICKKGRSCRINISYAARRLRRQIAPHSGTAFSLALTLRHRYCACQLHQTNPQDCGGAECLLGSEFVCFYSRSDFWSLQPSTSLAPGLGTCGMIFRVIAVDRQPLRHLAERTHTCDVPRARTVPGRARRG